MSTARPDLPLIVALCVMAFVVLAGYECARSPAKTILGGTHAEIVDASKGLDANGTTTKERTAERRPWGDLLVVFAIIGVVAFYNRYSPRAPLPSVVGAVIAVSAGGLVLVQMLHAGQLPGARYAIYVWQNVYIVLVLEAFWTFANSVFPLRSALRVYGLLLACGSLGSSAGARLARVVTSPEDSLWLVLPTLALAWLVAWWIARRSGVREAAPEKKAGPGLRESIEVLRSSRYVLLLAVLVFSTQMVIVVTEFLFDVSAAGAYPDDAARKDAISLVYEYVGYGALLLQIIAGAVIGLFGVGATMVLVPIVGAAAIVTSATVGGFALWAFAHALTKVLDYSLFKAAKEMLYLPLNHREKTQGKAVVDMAAYRMAKGGAALLLLVLGAAAAKWLTLVWIVVWVAVAVLLVRRYRVLRPG